MTTSTLLGLVRPVILAVVHFACYQCRLARDCGASDMFAVHNVRIELLCNGQEACI